MTKLSVNINKVATIRNARGGNIPNIVQFAIDCQKFGADGITVHPRPDERHIRYQDVIDLRPVVNSEFNIEGYPSNDFIKLVCSALPEQVTLVPDPPGAITSNAGWNTKEYQDFLYEVITELHAHSIRTSIFIDAIPEMAEYAAKIGADRVELYTESYAKSYNFNKNSSILPFIETARIAKDLSLGVNAGHDLNLDNLYYFSQKIPFLDEVSIGHALISDALYLGIEETIAQYKKLLKYDQ